MVAQFLPAIGQMVGSFIQGKMQAKAQKEANMKNSLQYKIAEAKAAGIHPLAMLGSTYAGSSPNVAIGAPEFGKMGQSIGSSLAKGMDETGKAIQALQLEKAGLENQLLSAQIQKMKSETAAATTIPSEGTRWLLDGQGQTALPGLIRDDPLKREGRDPAKGYREAGAVADVGYTRTAEGTYWPVKSRDAQQRLEDDAYGNFMWNVRNRILPMIGYNRGPPGLGEDAVPGQVYIFDPIMGYRPIPGRRLRYDPTLAHEDY